jgi:hypothetical protein
MNKTIKIMTLFAAILIAQLYLASALTIGSVTNTPQEIQPGGTTSLSLSIKNDMGIDVQDVVVSLILTDPTNPIPFAPYQSSSSARIDSINDGDSERVSFNLLASSDAASGTYKIPVQVSYTNDSGTRINNENLGLVSVTINAKPKIDVSALNPILIKGQNGKLTLNIVNSGLGESKFLSVSLSSVIGIQITNSNNVYIGNINSNDFDTADFNVYISQNAPSVINLPVEVTYMDSRNNQITEDETVSLKVYTSQEAKSLGLISGGSSTLIIILIVLAVIGFFVYRTVRKRRKNKLNGK